MSSVEKMLVWKMKNKNYHCSFCSLYPNLSSQGIKKVYIFDDIMPEYLKKDHFVEYYQCIDNDVNYLKED